MPLTIVEQPMTGWKTKLGSFLVAIGTVISQSAELFPLPEGQPWLKFIGYVIAGVGGAFALWGVGHKIEKGFSVLSDKVGEEKMVVEKKVPFVVRRINEDEEFVVRKKSP